MRFLKWLLRTLLVLIVVVGLVVGISWLIVRQMSVNGIKQADELPETDVALVFGAAVWNGKPSPYLQARLNVAADLYHRGKIKVVIVSGSVDDYYNEPKAMKEALVAAGVPEQRIVTDEGGVDTYSSCSRAHDVFGVRQVVAITQSYHLPRAIATCDIVGIQALGVGDDSVPKDSTWNSYVFRELPGDVKLMIDWIRGRKDADLTPSDAVQIAAQS
jgi:vancomycin permeability regulator SanA